MAEYLSEEIYSEVSKIFRTSLEAGREGGSLNTKVEYLQLLEVAATTFLFNDDAIYHLIRLAANSLEALTKREVALIEDTLVALEDMSQIGDPVVDSATLSNASTALLTLDAAASLQGRPETARFIALMDKYAGKQRRNVISNATGGLVRTREEAREIIRTNLSRLSSVHAKLVERVNRLRDIMEDYNALDIPGRVSTNALLNIRANLESLKDNEALWSPAENLARSRKSALTALASKTAVKLLAEFSNPQDLKYRSPNTPIPSTLRHLMRATGEGDPAYGDSNSGPWSLPLSQILFVTVDGGTQYSVPTTSVEGVAIRGQASEPFAIDSGQQRLIGVVDRRLFDEAATSGSVGSVTLGNYLDLSFKHLGAPVLFPDKSTASDLHHRALTELRQLQSFNMTYAGGGGAIGTGFVAQDDIAAGPRDDHVGCYVEDSSGNKFEVAEASGAPAFGSLVLVVPAGGPTPSGGSATLHGQVPGLSDTSFNFSPDLTVAPAASERCVLGPTVKVADLTTGSRTSAQIVSDIQAGNPSSIPFGAALNLHVRARVAPESPERVMLELRNRRDPFLSIGTDYLDVNDTVPTGATFLSQAANQVLGFTPGGTADTLFPSNTWFSPTELGYEILGAVPDVSVQELRTTVAEGDSLVLASGSKLVQDSDATFQSSGVAAGDVLVLSGDEGGYYVVSSVNSQTELEVSRAADFSSSASGLDYSIFRWRLRVSSQDNGVGSSLLFTAGGDFEFPTAVQYGSIKTVEAADIQGNLFKFNLAAAGDLLRLLGSPDEYAVTAVSGTTLTVNPGVPSNTESAGFEVRRGAAKAFESLNSRLSTFTSSANLLKLNRFDEDLSEVDTAITAAILPGQRFVASRERANRVLMDLLSILTDTLLRSDEYRVPQRVGPDTLLSILQSYSAAPSSALSSLINTFAERRYDRAVDLLVQGQLSSFFATDEESGSYGGALLKSSRSALGDLPKVPTSQFKMEQAINSANRVVETRSSEVDFSDTDGEQEISE